MVNQGIWIGIAVGVFFAGLGVGYAVFFPMNQPMMFSNQQFMQQLMMQGPQHRQQMLDEMMENQDIGNQMMDTVTAQHMGEWMNDPNHVKEMAQEMKENHEFMMEMMQVMLEDPALRLQMIGHMTENQEAMQEISEMMGSGDMMTGNMSGTMGQGMMGSGIQSTVDTNLARFDELDFEAFSKQNWELFNEIHAPDVLVVFPDGRQTKGIEQHDKDIMAMFDYAPDTKVTSHPIKFGSGEWTVSTGVLEGTFSQPMPLADGTSIPPTGKSFKVTMTTVAKWKDGRIVEEHLFWDNAEIMKQLGLGQ